MTRMHSLNRLRAKVTELTTETLEAIAEMILDLEADLEEMTDERDALQKTVADLEDHPND
jgi:hypothetical protein